MLRPVSGRQARGALWARMKWERSLGIAKGKDSEWAEGRSCNGGACCVFTNCASDDRHHEYPGRSVVYGFALGGRHDPDFGLDRRPVPAVRDWELGIHFPLFVHNI